MNRGAAISCTGAALLLLSGCVQTGELSIRAKPTGFAAGEQPVSVRVAEARGHFALNNVALALQGFRMALREDPTSVDAMNGIAACYDRMGRFDLSRRYYELALAIAPGDRRLYANLAVSLDLQGKIDEAASLRAEMKERVAAGQAALALAAKEAGAEEAASASSTADHFPPITQTQAPTASSSVSAIPLPIPQSPKAMASRQASATPAASSVSIALPPAQPFSPRTGNPRLERLSMGEVALVTAGPVRWKTRMAERPSSTGPAAAKTPSRLASIPSVTLLNAARSEGLAARTRVMLQRSGWNRIAIGNAATVRPSSVIVYPSSRRAEALRIASKFGFEFRHRAGPDNRLVIYLGRDAAALAAKSRT